MGELPAQKGSIESSQPKKSRNRTRKKESQKENRRQLQQQLQMAHVPRWPRSQFSSQSNSVSSPSTIKSSRSSGRTSSRLKQVQARNDNQDKNQTPIHTWNHGQNGNHIQNQNKEQNSRLSDLDTASNSSTSPSSTRRHRGKRGGRKNRSKRKIDAEGQQLAGEQGEHDYIHEHKNRHQTSGGKEGQQLWEAERALFGYVHPLERDAKRYEAPQTLSRSRTDSGSWSTTMYDDKNEEHKDVNGVVPQANHDRNEDQQKQKQPEPELEQEPEPQPELKQKTSKPSDTGIRAFSVRQADPNGGKPVGIKLQKNDDNRSPTPTERDGSIHTPESDKPSPSPSTFTSSEPREQGQGQGQQSAPEQPRIPRIFFQPTQTPAQGQQQSGEPSLNQGKEVSIKLDLNLEVELLLKTKIKGEIMVTFL
ncbi:hypothetical protein MPDQ_002902 [Monascus purpureus]|uniref:Uncharacterized protein n=1 Tax=Monascus purpureus TaxID=5098 RepID=A0A507QJN9_MONPU|nr:hypothetical protein MPDQ_002902 [Monascus purpureus]